MKKQKQMLQILHQTVIPPNYSTIKSLNLITKQKQSLLVVKLN